MNEYIECLGENKNILKPVADILFTYLRDVIYDPTHAALDVEQLPEEFSDFGKGLQYFSGLVFETLALAKEMASGNLNCELPPPGNEIAAPLKMLHSSLKHLTWQTQQVAQGDYHQRVDFMGDFSVAFNNMVGQLEERWQISLDEKSRLELYVALMLANCPDPILLFDRQGRLAYVSNSYLRCCEMSTIDEILGLPLRELFAPVATEESLGLLESMFEKAVQEKRTIEINQEIDFGHNGHTRHYQIQVTPMLNGEGNNLGVMTLLHDMTEIMRAQREAEHARELAERSSRAKSDFLARMSHEMRTPMNAIIGMTTIYGATNDAARKDYCLEKIDEAAQHLLGVINDVLDMSNIEADRFTLTYGACDLGRMIERVTGAMMFRVEEKQQRLTVDIDANIPQMLVTDEQRLAQVLTNLLSNAVKFSPQGGEIFLRAEQAAEEANTCAIRFTVKDNGVGILLEQQKRLFTPFEQAEGGLARKFGGTGLGLAISRHIVKALGGEIWFESQPGQGSAFFFEVPMERVSVAAPDNASDDNIFAGRTVLLAEDVEINREILAALLEHTGINIDTANDGAEALEKFATTPEAYDLILMDIHMPNMDGFEATRRIRKCGLPAANTIPIIAMTANVFAEDIARCLASGMNSHLGKPLDAEQVLARLKEYLA